MTSATSYLRAWLMVAAVIVIAAPRMDSPAFAQDNAARENRGDRGGRNGRRGDRPNGNRDGDRRDGERPADRPATAPAASTANSFGTVSDAERIRQSATETIKANDKDGNGILEGEELSTLGMSRSADQDGDGKITHNELVEFRTPKSTAAAATKPATPTQAANQPTSTEPAKRKIVNTSRKSYRFKTTKDRINNWRFSSRDANGDGQVSMSEFTRIWNDRTAREFQGYDKDNDGMITAEEAK